MIRKKIQEQKKTLKNINIHFDERNDGSMILEARKRAAEELKEQGKTDIKILIASKITDSSSTSKSR